MRIFLWISSLLLIGCNNLNSNFILNECISFSADGFIIDKALPENNTIRIVKGNKQEEIIKVICAPNFTSDSLEKIIKTKKKFLENYYDPVSIEYVKKGLDFFLIYFTFKKGQGAIMVSLLSNNKVSFRYTNSGRIKNRKEIENFFDNLKDSISELN